MTIHEIIAEMEANGDKSCIGCNTPEERNEVTVILHDTFGVAFGNSGYAEKYYNGDTDGHWRHPFITSGGIEYRNIQRFILCSYDEFMSAYLGEYSSGEQIPDEQTFEEEISSLFSMEGSA
jgi:hypothetical protein